MDNFWAMIINMKFFQSVILSLQALMRQEKAELFTLTCPRKDILEINKVKM